MIKVRTETTEIETRKTKIGLTKLRAFFILKINKTENHLARLTRKKDRRLKIRDRRGDIITDVEEIHRVTEIVMNNYMPIN